MGYFMRYIAVDERPFTLEDLRRVFAAEEEDYAIEGAGLKGTIGHDGRTIAAVELNVPGDGVFDSERDELLELAEGGEGAGKVLVLETLRDARCVLCVEVLFGEREPDEALDALGPLWAWLQDNRRGLLQADGEGYYDADGLILELE